MLRRCFAWFGRTASHVWPDDLSIKRQLVVSLMVVIIPFVLMGVITYRTNMDIVTRILGDNKLRALGETARTVDQMLNDVEEKARQVGWEPAVQDFLSKDEDLRSYADYKKSMDAQNMMIKLSLASNYINTLLVVPSLHRGFTNTQDGKGFLTSEEAMQYDWYQALDKDAEAGRWFLTNRMLDNPVFSKLTVTYVSPVKLLASFQMAGHVLVSMDRNAFQGIVSARSTQGEGKVFLIDSDYRLITSSDSNSLFLADTVLDRKKQDKARGCYFMGSGPSQSMITYTKLPRYGWQLVSMTSMSAISAELIDLSEMMYVIIIVCVVISLALAVGMYRGITRPLDTFVARMNSIAHGDFTTNQPDVKTNNEIKRIYNNFNWMSGRIAGLIEKNNETMLQKRNAELKALQAQINPHFLYNVLDTINWMAILKDEDDISRAITSLSAFYRTILNDGKDTDTVRQEIEHVKAYIEIEKLRYKNSFNVSYELDESLFELNTIKFILQPFVENSLMHGFDYSSNSNSIIIRLYRDGGNFCYSIEDNGEGITQEKIKQILSEKIKGYGISNVDERIKLRYGNNYGVLIESVLGVGTIVRISMPISELDIS